MRNLFLVSMFAVLIGCDVGPTSSTDVTIRTADTYSRFSFYHGETGDSIEGPGEYFENTYREVANCMGVGLSEVGYARVYLWDDLSKRGCGGAPCYSYNGGTHRIDLPRDLDDFDQGVSHEIIHMLLKATREEDYANCPATNEPRINEKPWVCQFKRAR